MNDSCGQRALCSAISPPQPSEAFPSTASLAPEEARLQLNYSPRSRVSTSSTYTASLPFTIQPEKGTIPPGKKAIVKVAFHPLHVQQYVATLICL